MKGVVSAKKVSASVSKPKTDSYRQLMHKLTEVGFVFPDGNKMSEGNLKKLLEKYDANQIISDEEVNDIRNTIQESTIEIGSNFSMDLYIENAIQTGNRKVIDLIECADGCLYKTDAEKNEFMSTYLKVLATNVLTESDIACCKINILVSILEGSTVDPSTSYVEYKDADTGVVERLMPVTSFNSSAILSMIKRLRDDASLRIVFVDTPDVSRKSVALKMLISDFSDRIYKL